MLDAEEATRKRKALGPKKPRKRASKATQVESGEDPEPESGGAIEVKDCIIVN